MCRDHDPNHWLFRRQTGWRLTAMRFCALGVMLIIGIGVPEIVKAF